ncbi:tryptophan halogenase family protein [Acinetobacter higginsii]|uniref:tryptophan halogenase family protein n=1 Tax=Acinetobacter higginsii TaxID=70347 RepID=UPI001F4B293D|nr:tryptophan halogenase family protein [Acinetobacter higginsii]MCH7296227.1 tryptophan 7-halogenase [Acinetobacter higginsii]
MLNLRGLNRVAVVGGGTAGWFAALQLRQVFSSSVEVVVISAPEIPIVGVGEGGLLNLLTVLHELNVDLKDFIDKTGSTLKLGFRYERWRTGKADDYYYHLFPLPTPDFAWSEFGFNPYLSGLFNHGIDISRYMASYQFSEDRKPFQEVLQILLEGKNNFGASLHFDTFRVGQYLKKIALARGILHIEKKVEDFELNSTTGYVSAIQCVDEKISCDFVIDASGFSKLLIGKKYQSTWCSFADTLPMNKALPFHLPHRNKIELVTRATAMNSGWVWQIPLQERIGAGYVYHDQFISDQQAQQEIEQWLGHPINPVKPISFEAGYFQQVWIKNVVGIGLASGFIEPLEATSIGQMLSQLQLLISFIQENHGVISKQNIDFYNQQNAQYWQGIRDFIRMHYDTGRSDTPFWQYMLTVPQSESYQELKKCWVHRTPRDIDFVEHSMGGMSMFSAASWFTVGAGVGVIKPEATSAELYALSPEKKQKLSKYLHEIKQHLLR